MIGYDSRRSSHGMEPRLSRVPQPRLFRDSRRVPCSRTFGTDTGRIGWMLSDSGGAKGTATRSASSGVASRARWIAARSSRSCRGHNRSSPVSPMSLWSMPCGRWPAGRPPGRQQPLRAVADRSVRRGPRNRHLRYRPNAQRREWRGLGTAQPFCQPRHSLPSDKPHKSFN